MNAKKPYREETQRQVKELETKFGVAAMAVNCDQLRKEDILHMLEKVLYEFPLQQMEFYIPKWVELLADDHPLKAELLQKIREMCREKTRLKDAVGGKTAIASQYVSQTLLQSMDLASGTVKVRIEVKEQYYYEMLSVLAGVEIKGEYDLVQTIRELSAQREEYRKVGGRDSCGARMRLRRRDSGEGGDSAGGASRDPSGKQIRREKLNR